VSGEKTPSEPSEWSEFAPPLAGPVATGQYGGATDPGGKNGPGKSGALKGRGNLGAAVIAGGVSSAFLLPFREKVPPEKGADEGSHCGWTFIGRDEANPSSSL